ncbi:MAG TPA: 2-amino-4-hydroxy-6-hydroxymethyldihydropteridine diphosphokinase [Novosphingobium sp.]|nr:2-amino-4-hydroxy-6-hydroxymethyldihydropteridine diphosphokinase [Novosphingobium sp.]
MERASPVIASAPVGPSRRRYANGAVLLRADCSPPRLLALLKGIEESFGRRPGQRWGARVLDLDIVLWSGGVWRSRGLCVPHLAFRERVFVLGPLAVLVPGWRDPITGRTCRQLFARLTRSRAAPRGTLPPR